MANTTVVSTPNWEEQKLSAHDSWVRSCQGYYAEQKINFFDYSHWKFEKACALFQYQMARDRARRRRGDAEIVERMHRLIKDGQGIEAEYRLTKSRVRAIEAIVSLTSDKGRLYCSYNGLSRAANISARTACTIRRELELLGVLKRTRTGGLRADGAKCSNKYTVKWNRLREILGVENRWDSRYGEKNDKNGWQASLYPLFSIDIPNAYYSSDGYAHYSRSARQMRRLAQRIREAAACVGIRLKHTGNVLSEQENCALTALYKQKKSFNSQPQPVSNTPKPHTTEPKHNKCTPQSGSLENQATPDFLHRQITFADLDQDLRTSLTQLPIPMQNEIVTYVTSSIPPVGTLASLARIIGNIQLKLKLKAALSQHKHEDQ